MTPEAEAALAEAALKKVIEALDLCEGPSKVYDLLEEVRYALLDLAGPGS